MAKWCTFAIPNKTLFMEAENQKSERKVRLGITHGDINGIGYEVIIKSLSDPRILELFTPIIYGHSKVASFHKKNMEEGEINFNLVKDAASAHPKRINIVNCTEQDLKIDLGISTDIAGKAALQALEMAVSDLKADRIDALVTAPINKQNIQSKDFDFPGHTEYLSERFGGIEPLMVMVWQQLRVATLTGHIPLKEVTSRITEKLLLNKLDILNKSLIADFGITKPKIAVLGINPHAGDGGLLGMEEQEMLTPALAKARANGLLVFGPYPADGFFGSGSWKKYDAVVSMYHDQGLAPFKSIAFDGGVNFTAGLPIVRTSPAHGTAYELAGKNLASAESFRQAMYLAVDIARTRAEHKQLTSNVLAVPNQPMTND
jgi:4-hydroxythreonine-4-phosphate dehydrogenase